MLRFILFFWIFFTSPFIFADTKQQNIKNVIYITFDGVRWQEIFLDHQFFKIFWQKYAQDAVIYGDPASSSTMNTASIAISLPSYQSQMAGTVQPCGSNICGRINVETFPEKLKRELFFQKKDIAVFSSWFRISDAVEHIENSVFTNTGNVPMSDPETNIPDAVMYDINLQQFNEHQNNLTRSDKYTIAHAMHYLEVYQPRFLWISLNDSDLAAHLNDLDGYHQALVQFDEFLDDIFKKLKSLDLYDQTMIIVTTDHGRGNGVFWSKHGPSIPASKKTWAFVFNGELYPATIINNTKHYNTLSIRPTIESVFYSWKNRKEAYAKYLQTNTKNQANTIIPSPQ